MLVRSPPPAGINDHPLGFEDGVREALDEAPGARGRVSRRTRTGLAVAGVLIATYAVVSRWAKRVLGRRHSVGDAVIDGFSDDTASDPETGAVRSIQSGEVVLPEAELEELWTPRSLERLARTYWRFLTRATLGIVRVEYTDAERYVVLFRRPFALLTFQAPEYEMDAERGVVRWRIDKGVLVARRGRAGRRLPRDRPPPPPLPRARQGADARRGGDRELLPVDRVALRAAGSTRCTQSRIHVLVTLRLPAQPGQARPGRVARRPLREPGRGPRPAGPVALRAAGVRPRPGGAVGRAVLGAGGLAEALGGVGAQLLAVVRRGDAPHRARPRAHDDRLRRRRARAG